MTGRNCARHRNCPPTEVVEVEAYPVLPGGPTASALLPVRKARRDAYSWSLVQAAVDAGIPNHRLHVIPGFCEGYRLHKSGHVTVGEVRPPLRHSAVAGIIGRERILHMPVIVI